MKKVNKKSLPASKKMELNKAFTTKIDSVNHRSSSICQPKSITTASNFLTKSENIQVKPKLEDVKNNSPTKKLIEQKASDNDTTSFLLTVPKLNSPKLNSPDNTISSDNHLEKIVHRFTPESYSEAAFKKAIIYNPKAETEHLGVSYGSTVSEHPPEHLYKNNETINRNETNETETMNLQEAKDTLTDIQYAQVTGSLSNMNLKERRRFANWAQYNPEFLSLFHKMNSLTNDVNYSRTF